MKKLIAINMAALIGPGSVYAPVDAEDLDRELFLDSEQTVSDDLVEEYLPEDMQAEEVPSDIYPENGGYIEESAESSAPEEGELTELTPENSNVFMEEGIYSAETDLEENLIEHRRM